MLAHGQPMDLFRTANSLSEKKRKIEMISHRFKTKNIAIQVIRILLFLQEAQLL